MKATRTKLARAIAGKTLKQGASKRLDREVAAYLLSENRVDELESLLRDIQTDWAEAGYVEVIARSAHPLTAAIKSDIARQAKRVYPHAKNITVTEVNDPEIIGGVRLELPQKQWDLSIEAKLNRFKQLTITGKD
jgi:F0F1-type ATP synthase delta subunit